MAEFDPYFVLGVRRNATLKTIQKAYRKKVQEHHPDRNGGERGMFEQVQLAWEVLSDPARRDKYDRTGDIGSKIDRTEERIIQILSVEFVEAMKTANAGNVFARDMNLVELVKGRLRERMAAERETIRAVEKSKVFLESVIKRVKVKDGENYLRMVAEAALVTAVRALEDTPKLIADLGKALKLADNFTWEGTRQESRIEPYLMIGGVKVSNIVKGFTWE